jgi:hypothetical protein
MAASCETMQSRDAGNPNPPVAPAPIESTAPPPAANQEVAAVAPPKLARFHNMRAGEVEALVGEPDFRRVEPPAELWQYRSAHCVVDFYLYGQGDAMHVIDADARGRDPKRAEDCSDGSQVLKDRLRASSG